MITWTKRLAARTKRATAASVAAIPGEAIPFLGAEILVAGTAYELYEACESMRDLGELCARTRKCSEARYRCGFS